MQMEYDLNAIVQKIHTLKQTVAELKELGGSINAVDRNLNRMAASIRVMELDFCDPAEIILARE